MSESNGALARIVGLLDDVAVQVRELEREAEILLHERGDAEGSADNMRRKAELLRDLGETLDEALDGLDGPVRDVVEAKLENLSQRAGMALSQGSVFWMRNLLYPDDYQDGEPNELEEFISMLTDGGEGKR